MLSKWPIDLFIAVVLRNNRQQVLWRVTVILIFLQCAERMSGKLQRKDSVLLIDSMGLTDYRGWSSFFAACTHWPNKARLDVVCSDQNPLLHLWRSVSPALFVFVSVSVRMFLSASPCFSLSVLSLPPPLYVSPAGQTAAELLQKRSIVRYGTAS